MVTISVYLPIGGSMARAPFQVLVFPYRLMKVEFKYGVFKRSDSGVWQGIAGGGEDSETPIEAAARESLEEAGLPRTCKLLELDSKSSIPVTAFADTASWGDRVFVIPEYSFGIDAQENDIRLSAEHSEQIWVTYEDAIGRLRYDGNITALWELNQKLCGLGPRGKTEKF
jgi:dihydroneopterin triphosphate diphosphatase